MTNKLNLPASYAVMNEEEMTYTQGGGALGTAATVVGAVVLGSSYPVSYTHLTLPTTERV